MHSLQRSSLKSDFNPRSPRGGATPSTLALLHRHLRISIHAPHEGERHSDNQKKRWRMDFNPRSPRGGATCPGASSRRGTSISIHAPHEGERLPVSRRIGYADYISIHAPHEGERHFPCLAGRLLLYVFQSTLPTRGSDDKLRCLKVTAFDISIHAPHEGERPVLPPCRIPWRYNFNPRSPRGGATFSGAGIAQHRRISIHAPHEGERPWARLQGTIHRQYFNPRSPRGGATKYIHTFRRRRKFQSTLPTRGSDYLRPRAKTSNTYFNPRSPRGGATHSDNQKKRWRMDFNPRSPRGGATCGLFRDHQRDYISIHAPHEGERQCPTANTKKTMAFQSTLPTRGSDPHAVPCSTRFLGISIHAPHEGERLDLSTYPVMQYDFNPRSPRGGATFKLLGNPPCAPKFQSTLPTRGSDCFTAYASKTA